MKEGNCKDLSMNWHFFAKILFQPNEGNDVDANKEKLQFAFEYLFGKDELKWVTIESDQAIMMSMALQGIVDEILREKRGEGIRLVSIVFVLDEAWVSSTSDVDKWVKLLNHVLDKACF